VVDAEPTGTNGGQHQGDRGDHRDQLDAVVGDEHPISGVDEQERTEHVEDDELLATTVAAPSRSAAPPTSSTTAANTAEAEDARTPSG
jgi:hypothetical protein